MGLRDVELTLINAKIDVQECDMGLRRVSGKVDGITTAESFKK